MQGKSVCRTHGEASRPHQMLDEHSPNHLIYKQLFLTDDVGVYTVVYKDCEYLCLKGGFYYFRRHVPFFYLIILLYKN